MDLLPGGDKDVLAEVGTVGVWAGRRDDGWSGLGGLGGLECEHGAGEAEEHPGELLGVDRQRLTPFARSESYAQL